MRGKVPLTRRYLTAIGVAAAVVAVDLLTKRYAAATFADKPETLIPGFLLLTYTENPGAAFSLFTGAGPYLGLAAIAVSGFVLGALRAARPKIEVVAMGLVLGGALGNLADRVFRGDGFLDGKVIDWVELWRIPTFNVADASITVAVALLLIHAWQTRS
ncbi:MAG: signal peptidase II [Acidimicrobiia bacterium]|nr:signal peptidase II [Acidimicrobiia bacterium]